MAMPAPMRSRRSSDGRARASERARAAVITTTTSTAVFKITEIRPSARNCSQTVSDGGIDELRQEGEEEGGRLGVQRLDHDAVAKGLADAADRRRRDDRLRASRAVLMPSQTR